MTLVNPVTALPPYVPPYGDYTNITPFTFRDGQTFLEQWYDLQVYIAGTLLPFIDANFSELYDAFTAEVNRMIDTVNQALATQDSEVDQKIADLTTYVDNAVNSIINNSISVQDPVMAGIINNSASQSRTAWNKYYPQGNEVALTPYKFGAVPPVAGSDNTAAITAMFAAATAGGANGGASIFFPPGLWRYISSTPLPLAAGLLIRGAGRGRSRLASVGSSSLFEWTTGIFGVHIEDITLECYAQNKGIFSPQGNAGIYGSAFRNLFLNSATDTSWIWQQNGSGSFIHMTFQDCEMARTIGSTVVPFSVITTSAAANFNKFDNVRFDGAVNTKTPFMHVETTLAATYLTDWVIINLLGEQNPWGLIRILGAQNWTLINCTDEDSTVDYGANLIDFQDTATAVHPSNILLIGCCRRGRQMVGGFFDIAFAPASSNINVINCNPTPASQTALIKLPTAGITILGTRGYPSIKQVALPPNTNFNGIVGDILINTAGGAGTVLWVKESGTAATGWVGK